MRHSHPLRSACVLSLLLLLGCDKERREFPPAPGPGEPPVRSVALSPQGWPQDFGNIVAFFEEAATIPRGGVMWNGAWRDDVANGSDAGDVPEAAVLTLTQSRARGVSAVLVFGWRGGESVHLSVPQDATNAWTNETAARLYREVITEVAATYRPPFLFLGNESDAYFASNPDDYARWVAVYEETYAAVKAVSPETLVGPIFQHEMLAGIGHLAGHTEQRWGALEAHDLEKVDVLGLTLYPFFAHATPEEIPSDYLAPLLARVGDTPLAITESGWPASAEDPFSPPWVASEEAQVGYVDALDRVLEGVDVRLVTWLYIHPPRPGVLSQLEQDLFSSVSLRDETGTRRPVYERFVR